MVDHQIKMDDKNFIAVLLNLFEVRKLNIIFAEHLRYNSKINVTNLFEIKSALKTITMLAKITSLLKKKHLLLILFLHKFYFYCIFVFYADHASRTTDVEDKIKYVI